MKYEHIGKHPLTNSTVTYRNKYRIKKSVAWGSDEWICFNFNHCTISKSSDESKNILEMSSGKWKIRKIIFKFEFHKY